MPQRQAGREPIYPWVVVGLFWLVYFLNHADRQIVFSVFPLLKQDLGLTDTQLGLLGSSFQWVYAALVPCAGFLGDAVSRRAIILAALLVWSTTTISSGMISAFVPFLALRALTGAGEAFYYPAATSIIGDYHGAATRSLAMSVHQTSLYFGVVTSGTLAGYLGQRFGWRIAFVVFGAAGYLLAALVAKVLKEPARGRVEAPGTVSVIPLGRRLAELASRPSAVILVLCFCGMSFASVAVVTWMPTLVYRQFGYSLASSGFHATFYHQIGAFAGVLLGGRLGDRWAVRTPLARPWVQALGLLGAVPFLWMLGRSQGPAAVFAALALFGFFRGLYDSNLFASLFEVLSPASRATGTGLMLSAGFLVGGSSPVLIGRLAERTGLGFALATTSVWYFTAGILMLLCIKVWFLADVRRMREAISTR